MNVGNKIRELRKERGLTLNQLASMVESDVGNLSRLERGLQGYSDQMLTKIAAALQVPVAVFFLADHVRPAAASEGDLQNGMTLSANDHARLYGKVPFDENVLPAVRGARPIPVISSVQAGALTDMEAPYPPGAGYAYEYTDSDLSEWAFALDIEGLSMMPEFRPGDRIIVDPEISPNPGDFVVAKNGSAQATFKKYRPRGIDHDGNEIFELVPLNDDYPTMRSDTHRLTVIGVMTEHRKKYRRPQRN